MQRSRRENLETLLKRQENYRNFQDTYFVSQDRTWTEDGLGYVSWLTIEDVRLAIIGLNSAWLAQGGIDDHGKLLVGERQVINAVRLAQVSSDPAHIVIAMAHHPFHLLQDFDRRPAMGQIERACHFLHCGHLHEPETRAGGLRGTGCLTLAAGASYETRQSRNSYSVVALDLLRAVRAVNTLQYIPADGAFSFASVEKYWIEVTPSDTCSVGELADAMRTYDPGLAPWAHYLSHCCWIERLSFQSRPKNGHAFASFGVLESLPDNELKRKTEDFMTFRNALRVLYKHVPLAGILAQHGVVVTDYCALLHQLCKADMALKDRLDDQEKRCTSADENNTARIVLAHKRAAHGACWCTGMGPLREQAQRHLNYPIRR